MFYMERFSLRAQTLTKILCLLFLFAFTITGLSAQVKLSVQGLVKKSDGTALPDGNYDLTFRFYDDETGGSALGAETVTTEINGGVYSAVLGPNGGLNSLAFNIPYYVSVAVDGGTELLPRIALSAAPYAISLQGANNKFPSIGTVKADAIDVAGAVNASGAVNATAALNVTGTATLNGTTNTKIIYADGRIHSNNGFAYHSNGTGNSTGLFFNNSSRAGIYTNSTDRLLAWDDNKNYYRATGGHAFDVGNVNISGSLNVGGNVDFSSSALINGIARTRGYSGGGGFTFDYTLNSGPNDTDSGMFGDLDGQFAFRSNGNPTLTISPSGVTVQNVLYLTTAPNMTDGDNLEWRSGVQGGRVGVNTSSRRYKSNIQPFVTDFSKILQVQPRIYNRKSEDPSLWEIGYIAEELDSLGLKNLVLYDQEGRPNSLIYKKMVIYTNEVVKMHHADIEKLKAEVAALTAEKNALRTENASLRADVQHQQADFGKQLDAISRRLKSLETAASNR